MTQLRSARTRLPRRGFTLIESALATVIVGVGIVASMQLFASCTIQNRGSANMTTALMLADGVREMMAGLPFADPVTPANPIGLDSNESAATILSTADDIDDFHGVTFNPPIDATRSRITELSDFSQVISVNPVDINKLSLLLPQNVASREAVRIQVIVLHTTGGSTSEVYRTSWVRVKD